jgi:CarD family transcriptional regulator
LGIWYGTKEDVMFKINDYVIYNSIGVYQIVDIRKDKDISNTETEYYVLKPVFDNNMTIKTPVNNKKVFIRKIMTRDQVLSLIASMPEKDTVWIDNDRERKESFMAAVKTGKSEEWVKLIKTIYQMKQEKFRAGKKLQKSDEDIMKIAEKNLYEEFAVVLDISPDEVLSYILDHIS